MVANVSKRVLSQNETSILSELAALYEVGPVSIYKHGFIVKIFKVGSDRTQNCLLGFSLQDDQIFIIPHTLLEQIDFENGFIQRAA